MMEGVDRVETGWRNALWVISGSTQTHTICSNTPVKPETLRWRLELLGSGEGPLRTFLSPLFFLALLFSRLAHPSVSVFTPDRTPACSVLIIKSPLGVLVCCTAYVWDTLTILAVCVCVQTHTLECVYLSAPMFNYFHEIYRISLATSGLCGSQYEQVNCSALVNVSGVELVR